MIPSLRSRLHGAADTVDNKFASFLCSVDELTEPGEPLGRLAVNNYGFFDDFGDRNFFLGDGKLLAIEAYVLSVLNDFLGLNLLVNDLAISRSLATEPARTST